MYRDYRIVLRCDLCGAIVGYRARCSKCGNDKLRYMTLELIKIRKKPVPRRWRCRG